MAGSALDAFSPGTGATVVVACTTTSGSTRVALVGRAKNCIVQNNFDAPSTAFVEFGSSTVTAATATSFPVQPGAILCLLVPEDATHVAGITAASTATVYVTTGDGN